MADLTIHPPDMPKASGAPSPAVSRTLGANLRAHRKRLGLSAKSLARAVRVSPSLISQIENGKANPSVGTLYAIVNALELSLDEVFLEGDAAARTEGGSAGPKRSSGPVLRAKDRPVVNLASGVRWERLTPTSDPDVDFLYVVYAVGGASSPPDEPMRHAGREYGLLLSGRLGAAVGDETYELEPGDSIVLDSTEPHRFWTIGDEPSVVAWTIVGRAGDGRAAGG
jgi:transcriptional regulator with XRE-family HTH domain